MIRIDEVWLALGASDLRLGIDGLLSRVVHEFGQAQAHHAYIFANRSASRLKVLIYDGVGIWLCVRRLQSGRFIWLQGQAGQRSISAAQLDWLVSGAPWQKLDAPSSIGVV
jgi:transposase